MAKDKRKAINGFPKPKWILLPIHAFKMRGDHWCPYTLSRWGRTTEWVPLSPVWLFHYLLQAPSFPSLAQCSAHGSCSKGIRVPSLNFFTPLRDEQLYPIGKMSKLFRLWWGGGNVPKRTFQFAKLTAMVKWFLISLTYHPYPTCPPGPDSLSQKKDQPENLGEEMSNWNISGHSTREKLPPPQRVSC